MLHQLERHSHGHYGLHPACHLHGRDFPIDVGRIRVGKQGGHLHLHRVTRGVFEPHCELDQHDVLDPPRQVRTGQLFGCQSLRAKVRALVVGLLCVESVCFGF